MDKKELLEAALVLQQASLRELKTKHRSKCQKQEMIVEDCRKRLDSLRAEVETEKGYLAQAERSLQQFNIIYQATDEALTLSWGTSSDDFEVK